MKKLTFQVLEGIDKGRIYRELPIPTTIGREEGNLLRLNDERISRVHAKIQREGRRHHPDRPGEPPTAPGSTACPSRSAASAPATRSAWAAPPCCSGRWKRSPRARPSSPTARTAHGNISPTLAGTLPAGDDMDFDLASGLATRAPRPPRRGPRLGHQRVGTAAAAAEAHPRPGRPPLGDLRLPAPRPDPGHREHPRQRRRHRRQDRLRRVADLAGGADVLGQVRPGHLRPRPFRRLSASPPNGR